MPGSHAVAVQLQEACIAVVRVKGEKELPLPNLGAKIGYTITFLYTIGCLYYSFSVVALFPPRKALLWANSQWAMNVFCIVAVEPLRCFMMYKVGKVNLTSWRCFKVCAAAGCCFCCIESAKAKGKKLAARKAKARALVKAQGFTGRIAGMLESSDASGSSLHGHGSEGPNSDADAAVQANMPEVILGDQTHGCDPVSIWV